MEININLNVRVGLTPNSAALLGTMLQTAPRNELPASEETAAAQLPEPEPEKPAKPRGRKKAAPAAEETPEHAPAAEEVQEPTPEPAAKSAEEEPPTEEYVRKAMHETRIRIEGPDYRENTTGEGYKRYHRQLTGEFKRISAALGAEKPSALPAEKRRQFREMCDDLYLDAAGELQTKVPF